MPLLPHYIPQNLCKTAAFSVSYLQQRPWTSMHIRVFVRHLFGNSLVIGLWNLCYFIVDRKAFAWWPQVIRIDFDANVHHLHLLIYQAVQTLPTWCFYPFLSMLMHRLQVITGKESNFQFIINAAKSEMLQGKCLCRFGFW